MTTAMVRGLRGATTCASDTPEDIYAATQELLLSTMERNGLSHDDVISIIFTTSTDLTAAFPALGAREVGFSDVPLLCASEIAVPGSMSRCIRILMHAYSTRARSEIHHVYLNEARTLRDDLPE